MKKITSLFLVLLLCVAGCKPVDDYNENVADKVASEFDFVDVDDTIVVHGDELLFTVEDEPVLSFDYSQPACTSISFGDNIGELTWENGHLEFEGDIEQSAQIFFEWLKPLVAEYIYYKLEKERR